MRKDSFIVTEDSGPRPAGLPDRCFYCQALLGHEHRNGCVIRDRTVVIEYRITMVQTVPEDWDEDMVNFHRNESSWCASNLINHLEEHDSDKTCLCPNIKAKYLREATIKDHLRYGCPSSWDETNDHHPIDERGDRPPVQRERD